MAGPGISMLKLLRLIGHQDWIRYGIRNRIISRFCNLNRIEPRDYIVDFFGLKYQGNLSCYLDWVVYFYGAYEKYELFLLKDLIKDKTKPVFMDVGANIGQHSLFMSKYCDKIHAFEPYEPVRKKLEHKILDNGIDNIVVHDIGLGCEDCKLDFYAPSSRNTGTGSFLPQSLGDNMLFEKLQVVDADRYISRLNLDKIDLVKIDVEGFEKNVLMGMKKTLLEHRPIILMEFSMETRRNFQGVDELFSMLPEKYVVRGVQTAKPFCLFFNKPGYEYIDFDINITRGNIILFPQ